MPITPMTVLILLLVSSSPKELLAARQEKRDDHSSQIQELEQYAVQPEFDVDADMTGFQSWIARRQALLKEVCSFHDPMSAKVLAHFILVELTSEALIELGPVAVDAVLPLMDNSGPSTRLYAIHVLVKVAERSTLDPKKKMAIRKAMSHALADRAPFVRDAANKAMPVFGGQSIPMVDSPLHVWMMDEFCFNDGYVAMKNQGGSLFILKFEGSNWMSQVQSVAIGERLEYGLRCDPGQVQILVRKEHDPSSVYFMKSFSVSDVSRGGVLSKTNYPLGHPYPSEFDANRFHDVGEHAYPLPSKSTSSKFELVTERADEPDPPNGAISFYRAQMNQKSSNGTIERQGWLFNWEDRVPLKE